MSFQELAAGLFPFWCMGILMIVAVFFSEHRDLLRVSFKGLGKFLIAMGFLTVYRFVVFKFLAPPEMLENLRHAVHFLPWQGTLGVFWEDAVHVIPLVLLARTCADKLWYKIVKWPLLIMVMIAFGAGHLYQGPVAAAALSFYIILSMKQGQKNGFGTVMIAHVLYDLITLLSIAWMVGG